MKHRAAKEPEKELFQLPKHTKNLGMLNEN